MDSSEIEVFQDEIDEEYEGTTMEILLSLTLPFQQCLAQTKPTLI